MKSKLFELPEADFITVNISTKWLQHRFMCSEEYIVSTCHGRCCEGSNKKTLISLLPQEVEVFQAMGNEVIDNKIVANPITNKCPHKMETGLCDLHKQGKKPFGCVASPFTLNKGKTLILRHRYSMFNCHRLPDDDEGQPAYIAFRAGLDLIFGFDEAERVCKLLAAGVEDIAAKMPIATYKNIYLLDTIKK